MPEPFVQNTHSNGVTKNGGTLPEIPHVINNIIPLSNVLKFYTQEAYKQLKRLMENLASSKESDVIRKKQFLKLIVSLRQDFIKIYTLVKWAQNSKDISKLIDLLNYFRGQEFFFEQLSIGINELNHFSGAKLPNSDLLTALEVLVKGRPQLPSYNYIERPKVSSEKTLQVLRDLDLALTARMAFLTPPKRFENNYVIKDGRIIIQIPNEFQVSITVGNDLIIDNDEDYYKSPFFLIDFEFLFGINPNTSLITHGDSETVTVLPKSSFEKLEFLVNKILLKLSLDGLYDFLHKYSIFFKLYLISKQLKGLIINSKWKGNIQFNYNSSKIIINYWSNFYISKNWKSFIEIGVDKNSNLSYRWFKNGHFIMNATELIKNSIRSDSEPQDLSVDSILSCIINKHSEELVQKIYDKYFEVISDSAVSSSSVGKLEPSTLDSMAILNNYQLLLTITQTKTIILAINPVSGYFYFMKPSPIETSFQNKINSIPSSFRNKSFISEGELVQNVVNNLIQLRLEILSRTIKTKLITTEWISNDIINLNDYETTKILNYIREGNSLKLFNKLVYYRCRNWPASWFLINMVSGLTLKLFWWVAKIKSVKGEWKIQWVQKLPDAGDNDTDYKYFKSLSASSSNLIINQLVVEELEARDIRFLKLEKSFCKTYVELFNLPESFLDSNKSMSVSLRDHRSKSIGEPTGLPNWEANGSLNDNTMDEKADGVNGGQSDSLDTSTSTLMALYNSGNLLPTSISATTFFLMVKLHECSSNFNSSLITLTVLGTLKGGYNFKSLEKLGVKINPEKEQFEISTSVDLSQKIDQDSPVTGAILGFLFENLKKVNLLIQVLSQLKKSDIKILNNQSHEITFSSNPFYKPFTLSVRDTSADSPEAHLKSGSLNCLNDSELNIILSLSTHKDEDKYVGLVVRMLNQEINRSSESLLGCFRFLEDYVNVFEAIKSINSELKKATHLELANKLPRLNFEPRFRSLNIILFAFKINSLASVLSKSVRRDTISFNVSFKRNKFDKPQRLLLKFSMRDNLNSQNLKYQKLFEFIFKDANDLIRNAIEEKAIFLKLNYDFVMSGDYLVTFMTHITQSFIKFLESQ